MPGEGILMATVTGADVTVGTDHIQNELLAVQPMARKISKIAIVGSTAAGDCRFELMVGGVHKGYFQNTSTGVDINHQSDVLPVDFFVGANQRVQAFCRAENAGANDVVIFLQFGAPRKTTSYRRTSGRKSYTRRSTSAAMR